MKEPPAQPTRPPAPPAADVAAKLQQAIAHHRQGQRAQAEALYREILALEPAHFDALNMLGLIEYQNGRPEIAVHLMEQAIKIDPDYPLAHLNIGNALRSLKRPAEALASYDRALLLNPGYVTAHYNRGIALQDLGRLAEALDSYDRALALAPDYVDALVNRGVTLRDLNRPAEALASYDRALQINPEHADALINRGNALRDLVRPNDALASYDRALRIKPDHAEALLNRGIALQELSRPEEGLASLDRALELRPGLPQALTARGNALLELKRPQEAIAAFRSALENGGDADQIRFSLAALGADASPAAAPKQFVTKLFDQYADKFDKHLIETLKYRTPALLFEKISRHAPAENLDILDLGCGTGLFGALAKPLARKLTGVDLSANMLEKARQRGIYDELVCNELTAFMQTHAGDFDIAAAADVFVYIGDLALVFQGVRGALRAGGLFGFSVESNAGEDFVLRPTRRYAHSLAYLQRLAAANNFEVESIEPQVIRQEKGVDVEGFLAVLRRL